MTEPEKQADEWVNAWAETSEKLSKRSTARVRNTSMRSPATVAASLLVITLTIGLIVAISGSLNQQLSTAASGSTTSSPVTSGSTPGWQILESAPIEGRLDPIVVWTGDEVLVWGGEGPDGRPFLDGARYDPADRAWSSMTPAPKAISGATAVWTGAELIAWGKGEPVAYTPATDSWAALVLPPIDDRLDPGSTWTGNEAIFWGGHLDDEATVGVADGAAYDPASRAWRMLARSPFDPAAAASAMDSVIWAQSRAVVVARPASQGAKVIAAAYEPGTDEWTSVVTSDMRAADATSPFLVGSRLVLLSSSEPPRVFDAAGQTWSTLPALPSASLPLSGVSTSAEVVLTARDLALDPSSGLTRDLPSHPAITDAGLESGSVWNGREVFVLGGIGPAGLPTRAFMSLKLP